MIRQQQRYLIVWLPNVVLSFEPTTQALAESRAQTQEVQAHLEVLRQSEQNMHILFQVFDILHTIPPNPCDKEKDRELLALREESQAVEQRSRQQLSRTQSTATQKIAQLSTDLDAAQLALQVPAPYENLEFISLTPPFP
jgi:multidrug resistance efflux pump